MSHARTDGIRAVVRGSLLFTWLERSTGAVWSGDLVADILRAQASGEPVPTAR
jgi:hypothetical protein